MINKRNLKVTFIIMFLALSTVSSSYSSAAMDESNVIPIVNLDAYGTYSNGNSGGDVWGGIVSGSVSPAIKYSDNLYFIPLYNGGYERQLFFAQVEEGSRAYNEIQYHDLSLTAKSILDDKAILSPRIFCGWNLNVETNDEDWGDGLYDYKDLGSGMDFDYVVYDSAEESLVLTNGFEWYFREYPNFTSLIALASVTAPEKDEKDFHAFEFQTGWKYSGSSVLSLLWEYTFLMKFFTDKKIIDNDGILEGKKRNEFRNKARAEAAYMPDPEGGGFRYSCSGEAALNLSNQNFYDSRGTVVLTDDIFTPNYFDYLSFEVKPMVSYAFKSGERTAAIISGAYDFVMTNYLDRKAQDSAGAYKTDDQNDYRHVLETSLEIPIDENISWVTSYDYTIVESNMDYELFYEYSYKLHRVLSGISFTY